MIINLFYICLLVVPARPLNVLQSNFADYYDIQDEAFLQFVKNFLTIYVLFSYMIPMSLYVTVELVKVSQGGLLASFISFHYHFETCVW